MIGTLALWTRRSSGPLVAPAMLAIALVAVLSRTGWQFELDRALSWASASTILLGPVLAGVVAFDVVRRVPPGLATVQRTARRGWSVPVSILVVNWAYAVLAWAAVTAFVVIRSLDAGAVGPPSPWPFIEAPVALLAAAAVGALVGSAVPNVAAGPLAAVGTYLVPLLVMPFGLSGLLSAGGTTASTFGLAPDPAVAGGIVLANLAIVLTAATLLRRRTRPRLGAPITAAVALVLLITALGTLRFLDPQTSYFRPVDVAHSCHGAEVEVCGPATATPLLKIAAGDLAAARTVLTEHGIELPHRYEMQWEDAEASNAGVVLVTPETVRAGHLDPWDVAASVATPSACPEYVAEIPPDELLDGQGELGYWVTRVLAGDAITAEDAAAARQTFDGLLHCDASVIPDWVQER